MKKQLSSKEAAILLAAFSIPVIWFAILTAQCCGEGVKLFEFLKKSFRNTENSLSPKNNALHREMYFNMSLLLWSWHIRLLFLEGQ